MAPFARPENVLKRADELIAVDQSAAALELLYDTISSKRSRNVSLAFLDPIILRFVELSVQLRKGKIVKDGLHQYKKIVQTTSIGSMEIVIKTFLELSEKRVTDAQAHAERMTLDADEDLEASDSPEDILMATVSSEQTKDRTDREVVTPWLKFLWEAYRSVLDVLRNNSKLEVLYQTVVHQAFSFCFKYERKTEFRRLCELLRNHLQSAAGQNRNAGMLNPIDLSDADTLQRYLDTRFEQLNVAVKLELWQEAFRSVEDVHTLLTVSKRPAKVSTMANYYENLARIFLVTGNQLYHAAAWSRFYSLVLQARSVPESELTRIASLLMLSVLAIPASNQSPLRGSLFEVDDLKNRNSRLTTLLNLTKTPTRESLLSSALSKNVLAHVRPEIRDLYKILEVDFHPLSIKKRLGPVIGKIGSDQSYQHYFKSLYRVILTRLFQQLSQVYTSVKLAFVIELASFPAPFNASPVEIERFIVRGCHNGEFGIRIDHESESISFKEGAASVQRNSGKAQIASLQATPTDIVRTQMSTLAKALLATVRVVDATFITAKETSRQEAIERAIEGLKEENLEVLERRRLIETRQKDAEAEQQRREEEDARLRLQQQQAEQQAEQQRLAEEQRKRELEQIKREQDAIREEEKRKIAEEINAKGIIKIDVNNMEDLDTSKLKIMQVEQLAKESKDLNERLRIIGRRMDHIERAYRLEEIDLWKKDAEEQEEKERRAYEARKKATLLLSKKQHEEDLGLQSRLRRIIPDFDDFHPQITAKRRGEFEARRAKNEKLLGEEKKKRIAQVHAQREAEKARQEAEAEEAARRAIEDEERAEEDRLRAEKAKQREAEEASKPGRYVPGALSSRRPPSAGTGSANGDNEPVSRPPAREPPAARPSPFGSAAPTSRAPPAARSSPFGSAAPVSRPPPAQTSASPFGSAAPVSAREPPAARSGASPFGNATPSQRPAPTAAPAPDAAAKPPTRGRYVAPSKR